MSLFVLQTSQMCLLFLHHELRVLSKKLVAVSGSMGLDCLSFLILKTHVTKYFLIEKCHGLFFLSVVNDLFHSSRPITGFLFGLKVFGNPCVQFTPYVYSAFIKVFNVLKIHLISQSYFRSCFLHF